MASRTQVSRTQPQRRSWSLVQRLTLSLSAGALFVALVLGFLGADRQQQHQQAWLVAADHDFAVAVAERASPLLERGDLMRLSVLATLARDQMRGRVLVLDRTGRVAIDTALVLGERQLGLLTGGGAFQRMTARAGEEGAPDVPIRETLVPVRFGGEAIGELRLQREVIAAAATFDFAWFALVLLCCLTLVVVAASMGHQWSARVRGATNALIRLSAGEKGDVAGELLDGELRELGQAVREMERGLQDGLQHVAEGFVGMAQQIVDGLERQRLVPPGHSERTRNLAGRLAERLQLLPADCADLDLACRLKDLGKAAVRAAILQKQGPLTEAEAASLRQHPVRAAEQLESMPPLRRVAKIVRHQQERYDGAGTPDGARGDRIPLGSRVLAIASAFDLMTTCSADLPLTWQEALQQLEKARGEVFDPWLVELFAEEVHKEPPATANDRPVMIVPGGSMPWRTDDAVADDQDQDDDVDEIEVVSDEQQPGESR